MTPQYFTIFQRIWVLEQWDRPTLLIWQEKSVGPENCVRSLDYTNNQLKTGRLLSRNATCLCELHDAQSPQFRLDIKFKFLFLWSLISASDCWVFVLVRYCWFLLIWFNGFSSKTRSDESLLVLVGAENAGVSATGACFKPWCVRCCSTQVSSALERIATLLCGRSGMDDGITDSSSSQPLRPKEGPNAVDATDIQDNDTAKNLLVSKTSHECSDASAQ